MAALVQQGKSAISGSAPNRSHPRRRNPARVRLASAKTASTRMRSGRCRTSPWLGCGPAVPLRRATAVDNPSGAPQLLVSREDFRKVRPIYSQSANSRSMPMRPSITEAVSVTHRTASYQACQAHEEHAGSRPRGAALALRNAPDRSGHMTRVRLRPFTAIRRGRFACFRSRPSPTPHARTIRPRARGCASSPVSLSRPPRGATEVGEALRRAHGGGASAADGDRLR